jgi:hypothetical protein
MGYGTVALKSQSKAYLFKLLEFNKIAIQESHQFMKSNSYLEKISTEFMFCEGNTPDFEPIAPTGDNIDNQTSLNSLRTV